MRVLGQLSPNALTNYVDLLKLGLTPLSEASKSPASQGTGEETISLTRLLFDGRITSSNVKIIEPSVWKSSDTSPG